MTNTGTTLAVNTAQVTGVSLIATKVDIPTAIFFLIFFSVVHALLVFYFARKSKDLDDKVDAIEFFVLILIALGVGMMFGLLGILSGSDEIKVYIYSMVGSLLGVKGITGGVNFFTKKVGIDINYK